MGIPSLCGSQEETQLIVGNRVSAFVVVPISRLLRERPGYSHWKKGSDRVIRVYRKTVLSNYNNSLLELLTLLDYSIVIKATLTTKGQLTIPLKIRERLNLKAGDVLDFDENAPFLKAVRVISPEAWEEFGKTAVDPWGSMTMEEVMNELRGPVELPPSLKS